MGKQQRRKQERRHEQRRVQARGGKGRPSIRWPVLLVAAALVAVALVVALVGGGGGGDHRPSAEGEVQPVTVQGSLPRFESPIDDPALGRLAPVVKGRTFTGRSVTITRDGRPKLVMLLAHWCPHCRREVPRIVGWLGGKLPAKVDLYAISSQVNPSYPNYPPSAWLAREHWPVPTIADDARGTAGTSLGLSGFPFFVAIGADGKVVARNSGELTRSQFEQLLAATTA